MSDEVRQHLDALRTYIDGIEQEIADKLAERDNANELVEAATAEQQTQERALVELQELNGPVVLALKEEISTYEGERDTLKDEITTLQTKKGDLMADNIKLEQENKRFRDYERKALKILEEKDEDLQNRERNIRQKEAIKPSRSSFLPER